MALKIEGVEIDRSLDTVLLGRQRKVGGGRVKMRGGGRVEVRGGGRR